jgi:chromosomal replication initiator protein
MIFDAKCHACGAPLVLTLRSGTETAPQEDFDRFATVRRIQREAAAAAGVTVAVLLSHRRTRPLVEARRAAIVRASRETNLSFSALGRLFHRDHTTIMNAIQRQDEAEDREARRANG